ncbi:hypothetical protein QBC32DRAFT_113721 [Pseudoneurospora amorphoporcata]|uniref:Uncharacterized protein n=1 Tax=Pseudoneurospora amorphoporcata TaxID=241081 RepID=A0AAN6NWZ9_9PEZI|nr:hypothetical protein QBC32DRAFT_113721 [Pseudoneurospora amorphoporcata]
MVAQGDLLDTLPRLAHFFMMTPFLYMSASSIQRGRREYDLVRGGDVVEDTRFSLFCLPLFGFLGFWLTIRNS